MIEKIKEEILKEFWESVIFCSRDEIKDNQKIGIVSDENAVLLFDTAYKAGREEERKKLIKEIEEKIDQERWEARRTKEQSLNNLLKNLK